MLVELTLLLVSGYDLIWVWFKLSGPAPVQSLRAENSCFQVGHIYDLFFCVSLCQQKTHGIIIKRSCWRTSDDYICSCCLKVFCSFNSSCVHGPAMGKPAQQDV